MSRSNVAWVPNQLPSLLSGRKQDVRRKVCHSLHRWPTTSEAGSPANRDLMPPPGHRTMDVFVVSTRSPVLQTTGCNLFQDCIPPGPGAFPFDLASRPHVKDTDATTIKSRPSLGADSLLPVQEPRNRERSWERVHSAGSRSREPCLDPETLLDAVPQPRGASLVGLAQSAPPGKEPGPATARVQVPYYLPVVRRRLHVRLCF